MSDIATSRILPVTRWMVYVIMALVAAVGALLLVLCAALPFYWQDVVSNIESAKPGTDLASLVGPMAMLAVTGATVLGLIWAIMRKLLAIVRSVEQADPFILENAVRLKAIGWMMVAVQVVGLPLAIAAGKLADGFGENDVGIDVSLNGILAILLVFILAGIFERGAAMREELEGTV